MGFKAVENHIVILIYLLTYQHLTHVKTGSHALHSFWPEKDHVYNECVGS